MNIRNFSVFICITLASCAANPPQSDHGQYKKYTVQVCMPNVGSIVGDEVGKFSIATLFMLPVGRAVDGYRVYQTDVLDTQSSPLRWIVVGVHNNGQKRYFSYSSGYMSPRQIKWSAWRPVDFWTYDNPSMSFVHGGTAFRPAAPSTGSPVMRYRVFDKQEPNWIVEHRLHGEATGLPTCNE